MKAYLRYVWYVFRHKWYVLKECRALGVGWKQALLHDLSKFSTYEFPAYVDYWSRGLRDIEHELAYHTAWEHHITYNPHHWEHWVFGDFPERIPEKYVREMIADWRGMGLTLQKGRDNAVHWYMDNYDRIKLHPDSRKLVDFLLLGIEIAS